MRRFLLPLIACALAAAPIPPTFVERFYARGWYTRLQPVVTGTSNLVSAAWLDVLVIVVPLAVVVAATRAWRRTKGSRWRRVLAVIASVAQAGAAVYLVFLLLWGLNYRRAPAAERFQVSRDRVTAGRLTQLGDVAVAQVNLLFDAARDVSRLAGAPLVSDLAPAFARAQRQLGSTSGATPGWPKRSALAHTFPLAGVDGMVNPFGLEVIVNPEVLPIERPFVLAHEWGHLAGHAAESDASFVAFLTCLQGTRAAQYSGWLDLFLHVARGVTTSQRRDLYGRLQQGPRADLRAIALRVSRAHPTVQRVSWSVYDEYLRANRVEAGIASYDEVVTLVLGSQLTAQLVDGRQR